MVPEKELWGRVVKGVDSTLGNTTLFAPQMSAIVLLIFIIF